MTTPYYNCEYIKDVLPAYIARLLGSSEQSLIESHIASCEECKEALNVLQRLSEKIESYENNTLPDQEDFNVDIDAIINKVENPEIFNKDEISAIVDVEYEETSYLSVIENIRNNENYRAELLENYRLKEIIKENKFEIEAALKPVNEEVEACQFVNENLSAYIDSELTKEENKQIATHLLQCSKCRKEFDNLKKLLIIVKDALLEPAKNVDYWPIIEKKLSKANSLPMYAFSTVASFAMVVIAWNFLSYTFPIQNNQNTMTVSQISTKPTNHSKNKTIADNPISSDQYLFSNVYDTPPSGVIPIMYDYNGLNKDKNKNYDY